MSDDTYTDIDPVDAMDQIRDDLRVPAGIDAVAALLNVEQRFESIREPVTVPLLDGTRVEFILKPLDDTTIDEAQERCTHYVKRGRGARVPEVDGQRLSRLLIIAACESPKWEDSRIAAHYGARDAETAVQKALLPGTVDGLGIKIMEISGYTDDLVAAGKS